MSDPLSRRDFLKRSSAAGDVYASEDSYVFMCTPNCTHNCYLEALEQPHAYIEQLHAHEQHPRDPRGPESRRHAQWRRTHRHAAGDDQAP